MRLRTPLAALALWMLPQAPALADQTIDQLGSGSALTGTEKIPMFQGSNPAVNTTPSAIGTYLEPVPADNLTANANNLQSTTSLIAAKQNYFTTVTSTNNSTKIPAAMMVPGSLPIYIKNSGVNQLNLFGDTGVSIDNLAANTSWPIVPGATAQIIIDTATKMHTVP